MPLSAEGRRAALALGAIAVGLTLVRAAIACRLGLAPDEAYYWTWSRHLALTYPDHPPLVAFAIAIGSRLVDGELGVRLGAIAAGAAALPLTYLVGTAAGLRPRPAVLAAGIAALLPAPSAGALIMTPDPLVGLAWLLGGLALARLAGGGDRRYWIALGAATGAGLLAKHSALLLAPTALAACVAVPSLRGALRTRHPWIGLAVAALVAAPYLIAELLSGAPSLGLQIGHLRGALDPVGAGGAAAIPRRLAELAGGQIGLLTPPVAILLALSFGRPARDNGPLRAVQLLALAPIAATALAALGTHPEQNWASLGHPFAAVAAIAAAQARFAGRTRLIWLSATAATALAAAAIVHLHALSPFLPLPPERDPVSRLHGYAALRDLAPHAQGATAIVCDNYGLASELAWERRQGPDAPPIASLDRPRRLPPGRWILLDESGDPGGRGVAALPCRSRRELAAIPLRRSDGAVVRTVRVYACEPISGTLPPA